MPFCSRNPSVISPKSKEKVAMFLLIEGTEEEVSPGQQTRYPQDFASQHWVDSASEDATHKDR